MRNHDEKTKDMIESVLPSTRRKGARRERRMIHKRARSRQRDMLATYGGREPDDFAYVDPDFREGRRKASTHWMVLDRRAADNVGALTRWAVETVRRDPRLSDAPLAEQVAHFAGMLPRDLIGRHAVRHIAWALEFEARREEDRARWHAWTPRGSVSAETVLRLRSQTTAILDAGLHGHLNDALRSAYWAHWDWREGEPVMGRPARFLAGRHDVEAFVEAVAKLPIARAAIEVVAQCCGC